MLKIGYKSNYLTIISNEKKKDGDYTYFLCQCKCEKKRYVVDNVIRYKRIQDCGCGMFEIDLLKKQYLNKKINNLTILDFKRKKHKKFNETFVLTKCDCGNEKEMLFIDVKAGHSKSCGCLKKFNFNRDYKNELYHNIKILELLDEKNKIIKALCHCGNVFECKLVDLTRKDRYIISCEKCNNGKKKHAKTTRIKTKEIKLKQVFSRMKNRCYNIKSKDYKWYGARGIKVCKEWLNDYKVFETWALENGYQEHLTIDRIDNDGNYEPSNCRWVDMITQNNNKEKIKKYNYNGEMLSVAQISKIVGINYRTLNARLKRQNMSLKQAIETPIKKG